MEIARALGLKVGTVHRLVRGLKDLGQPGKPAVSRTLHGKRNPNMAAR